MLKKDNEFTEYGFSNPDGRMENVYETKNDFTNDKKDFVNENNVSGLKEQEKFDEKNVSKVKVNSRIIRKPSTNLVALSGFFATTTVAVASAIIIVAFVLANSIINVELYAVTYDTLTFYVQCEFSEESPLVAKLYDKQEQYVMYEYSIMEPFLTFYELNPDTYYTFEVYDTKNDEVVFTSDYKTAPDTYFPAYFESWVEVDEETWEATELKIYSYSEQDMPLEDVDFYTISVYDGVGKRIFVKDVDKMNEEYSIDIVDKEQEMYYVGVVYYKNGYSIGYIQYASKPN